ncbi:MAG: hypothetical protein PHQ40_20210 [Anaerolineaceae bacterium]|nr:hypothetical protein [Anaerolineaceae bacterium]
MKKLWKPAILLVAVVVMVVGVLGSGAWFTDHAVSGSNSITTGTLSINDGALTQATFTLPNMAPGDKTGNFELYITNNGNINLAWLGNLVISGPSTLGDYIYIDSGKMEFLGGNWTQAADNFIVDGTGSGPSPEWYNQLASLSSFNKVTLNNFDGTSGMGAAPYEFIGALRPGFAYRLTLSFGMVEQAGNTLQNLGPLNIKFVVDATQVNEGALNALLPGQSANLGWYQTQIANQH